LLFLLEATVGVDSHLGAGMIRKVLKEDIAKGWAQAIAYTLYEPGGFAVEFSPRRSPRETPSPPRNYKNNSRTMPTGCTSL